MDNKITPINTRIATTNGIVHNDLCIGVGKVTQDRGHGPKEEQAIEVMFIFRDLDDIKRLDTDKYTRVGLHRQGALLEYVYDRNSERESDDFKVVQPYIVTRLGRWLKVPDVQDLHDLLVEKGIL